MKWTWNANIFNKINLCNTRRIPNKSWNNNIFDAYVFIFNEIVTVKPSSAHEWAWIEKGKENNIERQTRKTLSGSLVISFYTLFHFCVVEVRWCQVHRQKTKPLMFSVVFFLSVLFLFIKKKETITENLDKRTEILWAGLSRE